MASSSPEFPHEPRPVRARLRFPKEARLFRRAEFQRVRADGRDQRGRHLIVSLLAGAETGPSRFGIITSRRVGMAVVRSRVRRRLREILRLARPRLVAGAWIVLIARPSAGRATSTALREEWERLITRLGGIASPPSSPPPVAP